MKDHTHRAMSKPGNRGQHRHRAMNSPRDPQADHNAPTGDNARGGQNDSKPSDPAQD